MLHKNLPNSVKDVDAARGVVCGYASSFNVVDDGNDMVLPGAFTKTIAHQGPGSRQPRIKFLYQHDTTQILGVPQLLKEDGFGLYFEAKIAPTTLGRDVLTLYQEGCITEHSIGYETVEAEWDRSHAVRLLKELRLFEFSSVTFGMNPETPTVAVKSLTDPDRLSAIATKAAKLDALLHDGALLSDALCESLERELKALHAALAPTPAAASQPYTIGSVLSSMNDLTSRLQSKAASDDDKAAQEARAKKYGIGIKDGGNVTKPGQWKDLDDSDFGDPVNYKLPMPDKAHADNAASRFGQAATRDQYTKAEQVIIDKRIAAAQKKFGEDDSTAKGATMNRRMVKGSGGDLAVSENGTHAAYTGTHAHSHKAMGSQGDDTMHEHEHSHDGNASHGHEHKEKATGRQPVRKARDFSSHFQALADSDQLQDDWGDTFIAIVHCFSDLMYQAVAQTNGWAPEGEDKVDIAQAASDNLDAFKDAVMDLVNRSVAADFAPYMDYDGDQFLDPDGVNADEDDDDGWKSRQSGQSRKQPQQLPDYATLVRQSRKAGRELSNANRDTLTSVADGIAEHVKGIMEHHGTLTALLTKTDPDRVRQDEDDTQGDSDTQNGGRDINQGYGKSRAAGSAASWPYLTPTPRRTAVAERPSQAGTTHRNQGEPDMSALGADLDALKSRLMAGKQ